MVTPATLDVQKHDPARGPFSPQFDPSFSMMTGTRPMRPGKTAEDRGDCTIRRSIADALYSYMETHKPTNSREYNTRVKTRLRKNLAAGLVG